MTLGAAAHRTSGASRRRYATWLAVARLRALRALIWHFVPPLRIASPPQSLRFFFASPFISHSFFIYPPNHFS
jgi:hypothetical protein